jgi:hypothetical protein
MAGNLIPWKGKFLTCAECTELVKSVLSVIPSSCLRSPRLTRSLFVPWTSSKEVCYGQMIRPKRIYFPEHFCYCFSSNLCVLNKLTWTNAIFSRIAPVSHFCAEIQLSVKIWKNIAKILFHQKTHGAKRQDGEGLGGRHTTRGRGPALAAPTCCVTASAPMYTL